MGLPGAVVPIHHKRAATRRADKGTRPAVGRNGLLDVLRRSPDAQGIALHTAPTQERPRAIPVSGTLSFQTSGFGEHAGREREMSSG